MRLSGARGVQIDRTRGREQRQLTRSRRPRRTLRSLGALQDACTATGVPRPERTCAGPRTRCTCKRRRVACRGERTSFACDRDRRCLARCTRCERRLVLRSMLLARRSYGCLRFTQRFGRSGALRPNRGSLGTPAIPLPTMQRAACGGYRSAVGSGDCRTASPVPAPLSPARPPRAVR